MSEDTLAFSIEQAATLTGIGRTRLYQEISDGRLEARKAGKRTLITRDALERFIASLPSATEVGSIRASRSLGSTTQWNGR
jgi:excisionase family DNA binding protein